MAAVITLTTDFGTRDPYVAEMKAVILGLHAAVRLVDVTHDVAAHDVVEAGLAIEAMASVCPRGTVHVAVVDPGVGTSRDIVAVEAQGHLFLAPDNGLLAPIVIRHPEATLTRLQAEKLVPLGITQPSATFHGRDIFAPVAAELAAGRCRPTDLGDPLRSLIPAWVEEPSADGSGVSGVVITIDTFGNLITNIDGKLLERFANPQIRAGNHVFPLRRTYGDVQPGDYLALINSFGVLEIARAEQSAAEGLGLSRGAPVTVRDR